MTTYKIKKGDNLTKIARNLGVSMEDLIKLNNIKDANKIYAGQELQLPDYYNNNEKPQPKSKKVTIKKGQTKVITAPGHPQSTVPPQNFIIDRTGGSVDWSRRRVAIPSGFVAPDSTSYSIGNPYGPVGITTLPGAIPPEATIDYNLNIFYNTAIPYQKGGGVIKRFKRRNK